MSLFINPFYFVWFFRLPVDDISVPIGELPDPESDSGNSGETLRQLENKWTDLALTGLADSVNSA